MIESRIFTFIYSLMKRYFTVFVFALLGRLQSNAQSVDKIINTYTVSHPFEQVYVHVDNNWYSAGDTIWFKAYVLANALPSAFSANLYADWFDTAGKLLSHETFFIAQGECNGQFSIPSNYSGNKIYLLAYTRWMLNEDTITLFHKAINIIPVKPGILSALSSTKTETQKTFLQFFPEGGNLVAGVVNKIAFKATDQNGNPIELTAIIKNNHGVIRRNISTIHDGMGYFYLNPRAGNSYMAQYARSPGDTLSFNLPEVQSSGIAMEVVPGNGIRKVILRKSENASANSNETHKIYLLTTQNGFTKSLSAIQLLTEDTISIPVDVPVSNLPSGIITFTVFDEDWSPLAERVSFIRGADIDNKIPQLSITEKNLDKKKRNSISLQNTDSIAANLSIAITDEEIPADTVNNITSYLLLTENIKGKIKNPAYYFEDSSVQRQQQLDLVMLTNGWRRYNWQQIKPGNVPKIHYQRDSAYFFLAGNIINKKSKQPQKLSFLFKNKESLGDYNLPVNNNGYFADSTFIIYDTTRISYRFNKNQGIEIKYLQLPEAAYNIYPFLLDTSSTNIEQNVLFKSFDSYKTLALVTVVHRKKYQTTIDSIENLYESPLFKSAPALKTVYLENNVASNTYGVGVNDFRSFILSKLSIDINDIYPINYNQTLQYFVDEHLTTKGAAAQTPASEIVLMKYYKYFASAPGGGGGAQLTSGSFAPLTHNAGVLAIYTKRGESETKNIVIDNPLSSVIIGYTVSKEFYSPDYSVEKDENFVLDRRKTLYWNPQVDLNNSNSKNLQFSFYNNDYAKKIRIIIEGIKSDGTPIHIDKVLE